MLYGEITAIGRFRRDIVPFLEYPSEVYRRTEPGAPIIVDLFGIFEGTSATTEFASLLGITDPWDINQHHIDAERVDTERLRTFLQSLESHDAYAWDVERFERLREAGFEFYFRPNG